MITIDHPNFQNWLEAAKEKATAWHLHASEGAKYIRVIKSDPITKAIQPLPYAFIDRFSGAVFLAANGRFPAKKFTRGSIFDSDFGASKLGPDSPIHMPNGKPLGYKHIKAADQASGLTNWP